MGEYKNVDFPWKRLATMLFLLFTIGGIYAYYDVKQGMQQAVRILRRFDLHLRGRVAHIQPLSSSPSHGILYLRLSEALPEPYDPRDTTRAFYAVAEGRWAALQGYTAGRTGQFERYEVQIGDSLVVEDHGLQDSLFVYRCDTLIAKDQISVLIGTMAASDRRAFTWPPPDSFAGRGEVAYHTRCGEAFELSK